MDKKRYGNACRVVRIVLPPMPMVSCVRSDVRVVQTLPVQYVGGGRRTAIRILGVVEHRRETVSGPWRSTGEPLRRLYRLVASSPCD